MTEIIQERLILSDFARQQIVFGPRNSYLKKIEREWNVDVTPVGEEIRIKGESIGVHRAKELLQQLYDCLEQTNQVLNEQDLYTAIRVINESSVSIQKNELNELFSETIHFPKMRDTIHVRSKAQAHYINEIRKNDIVFGIGPAGTGKTYLAMALALSYFYTHKVRRIILTRPAVETGEKIGFLPGDMLEKVAPYLRPLYDALFDIVGKTEADMLIDLGHVEVAPLGFMRGRTLNDSFIILDEAQNTTRAQMKMLLTRIGFDSCAVITGDISQIDLPHAKDSGLIEAQRILQEIKGISFCEFTAADVVRHPLVKKIIAAYDAQTSKPKNHRSPPPSTTFTDTTIPQ